MVYRGRMPDSSKLLGEAELVLLKRRIFAMKRDNLPPVVTHNMVDDENDPIITHLRRINLCNRKEDRVRKKKN